MPGLASLAGRTVQPKYTSQKANQQARRSPPLRKRRPLPPPYRQIRMRSCFIKAVQSSALCLLIRDEYRYFIDTVIFDHMVRSAAWPALDMNAYPDRIDIYRNDTPSAEGLPQGKVYHVFMQDGKPLPAVGGMTACGRTCWRICTISSFCSVRRSFRIS